MLMVQCEGRLGGSVVERALNRLYPQVKPVKSSKFVQRVYCHERELDLVLFTPYGLHDDDVNSVFCECFSHTVFSSKGIFQEAFPCEVVDISQVYDSVAG
jgi:hypothetical protein